MVVKCEKWQFGTQNLLRMGSDDVAYVLCQDKTEDMQLRSIVSMYNSKKAPEGVRFTCNIERDSSVINELGFKIENEQKVVRVAIE